MYPPSSSWGDRVYTTTCTNQREPRNSSTTAAPGLSLCQSAGTSVQSSRLNTAREEQNRLFRRQSVGLSTRENRGKKRRRSRTWGHDFVCLANTSQTKWRRGDHGVLKAAGLGSKHVTFADAESVTCSELRDALYREFPKLSGQGFELLRLRLNSSDFEEILLPQHGYTPLYLRSQVHSAKIFVRPVVSDLSLFPVPEVTKRTEYELWLPVNSHVLINNLFFWA